MRREVESLVNFIIGSKTYYTQERILIGLHSVNCSLYQNNTNSLTFLDNETMGCFTLGVEKKITKEGNLYKVKYCKVG